MNEAKEVATPGRKPVVARLDYHEPIAGEQPTVLMYATREDRVDAQFTVEEASRIIDAWREMLAQYQPRISPPAGQNTNTGKGELYI